ncbi:hypothetical protein PCC8801_1494 [Rippkaea orientalis PCC 8801]|uniref:Uncharacterized protein n=1 Tax=Rippkaea orientalis (strain PCC 8801 / RF-1) TaxID=41431 RepID=B7JUK6_RIPO1|nr:hypothetical protein PCC8801_1494 [Rippkaea orientalis PCC 8801]
MMFFFLNIFLKCLILQQLSHKTRQKNNYLDIFDNESLTKSSANRLS